ncbi:hypothetical protein RGU76_28925 [Bacillus pseudomycoides]|uniref:hypothetical protein n=1 Tax=Bacillus TaxID=1386 RepID=UPI002248B6EF|nr:MULTISPECIES: hypothetical protein [Bacillus]MCX2829734.1 hypothetical protein [Bacillus sp. DHT2]MDR4918839.1 hypothetical protein [Bacillus pseudomycoides]
MKVNYLNEMIAFFQEVLYSNHDKFKKQQLQATNQLKSYVIENHLFHSNTENNPDLIFNFFKEFNGSLNKREFNILATKDENLFINHTSEGALYIDTSNRRFWKIHSVAKVELSDYFHTTITKRKGVDRTWLPIPFLLNMRKFGEMYGLGVTFTEKMKEDKFDLLYLENKNNLNMDIRRLYVNEFLELIQNSDLKTTMGIGKISILDASSNGEEDYIIDDITYYGKLTARGTSFSKHNFLLDSVLNNYEKVINNIESTYSFNYNEDDYIVEGYPLEIQFNREDIDLYTLTELLFSGNKPFNLWGIPQWKNEDYCTVSAVDLHNGNQGKIIDFEVFKNKIRVYVPRGTCGNSVARLLTNLHQFVDATSVMKGVQGNEFFSSI